MDALEASINTALNVAQTGIVGPRLDIKTNLDFQPYMKTSERLNTYPISDWSAVTKGRGRQAQSGVAGGFSFKNDDDSAVAFNNEKTNKSRSFLRPGAPRSQTGPRQAVKKLTSSNARQTGTSSTQRRVNNMNQNKNQTQNHFRGRTNREITRSYSCAIPSSWENITRFPLTVPHGTSMPSVSTIKKVGVVDSIHPDFKHVSTKQPKLLQMSDSINITEVPIDKDPYIQEILKDSDNLGEEGTFVMTSTVAALLMCAHLTIQPWDLEVVVGDNKIAYVTTGSNQNNIVNQHLVDEITSDRLPQEADSINSITSLAAEATQQQLFTRYMVVSRGSEPNQFPYPCPQVADTTIPAITAYTYRCIYIDDISVIIRAPLHAHTPGKPDETVYIGTCFEFDGSFGGYHIDYRKNLDTLFASVFSNELKTNSAQMQRLACEAMLAGSDEIKLYWISRLNASNNTKHQIVGATSHSFQHLLSLLQTRRVDYYDGLANSLIELTVDVPGTYTLLREPNERSLSLYKQNPIEEELTQQ